MTGKRGKNTSPVWKYFTPISDSAAKCNKCGNELKRAGGTTNLRGHLKAKHFALYFELENGNNASAASAGTSQSEESDTDVDNPDGELSHLFGSGSDDSRDSALPEQGPSLSLPQSPSSTSQISLTPTPPTSPTLTSTPTMCKQPQQTSLDIFKKPDAKGREKLNIAVAYGIGTCNMPYNTIEKPGFKTMLQCFKPGYQPVGRKALTETYIPKLYSATKQVLQSGLVRAPYIAVTSDTWTSEAGEPYIAMTGHGVIDWKMISLTLCCRAFNVDHTGQNISEWFLEAFSEWGLVRNKITSFTIDNGDNVRRAVDLVGLPAIRCIGHVIQNGVSDIEQLPGIKELKKRVHALQYFFSSDKVWRRYKTFMLQRYEGVAPRKLPGVSPTRWWSDLPLYAVAVDDEKYHREFLANYENGKKMYLSLRPAEIQLVKILSKALQPLEELTSVMSGEHYVTASAILPVTYLIESLQESPDSDNYDGSALSEEEDSLMTVPDDVHAAGGREHSPDQTATVTLNRAIILDCVLKKLKKRYVPGECVGEGVREVDHRGAVECHKLLVKCSFLDPRFKGDIKEGDILSAKEQLVSEHRQKIQIERQGQSTSTGTSATSQAQSVANQPKKMKVGFASVFAKISGSAPSSASGTGTQRSLSAEEKFAAELVRYEAQPSLEKDEDPLLWWHDHAAAFPALQDFALKYLCCPGTSTASERVFSAGGRVITDQRVCLTGEHAEQQIFLSMNQEYVPKPK